MSGDTHVKSLLTLSAAIELAAGLALLVLPPSAFKLLLGSAPDSPVALTVAHVAAIALLALGVGCWVMRRDSGTGAAKAMISAMLVYNVGVAAVLAYAALALAMPGIFMWPAALLHTLLALWCIKALLR